MKAPNVWVVVPAYNEADVLADVIIEVRAQGYQVVCVDDGSTDGSAQVARRAGANLVVHPANLGQGAAIQTGIDFALDRGADLVCTFDADGQHDAADLPILVAALAGQRADFALGSRFLGSAVDLPPARQALLRAAIAFTRLSSGLRVTDTHNGLRAMTRRAAACIHLRHDRMAHASEILTQIRRSRLRMIEVPVTVRYTEYSLKKGQRSLSAIRVLTDLAAGLMRT